MAEKIKFTPEGEEAPVEFFVIEQTTLAGVTYTLVSEEDKGDSDAYILKDLSEPESTESIYEIVTDDDELDAVMGVFSSMLEDVEFLKNED